MAVVETEGVLHVVYDIQTLGKNNDFLKRTFVLEETIGFGMERKKPSFITFTLLFDNVDKIDQFEIGDSIRVFGNLTGNRWESKTETDDSGKKVVKYFNQIAVYNIRHNEDRQDGSVLAKDIPLPDYIDDFDKVDFWNSKQGAQTTIPGLDATSDSDNDPLPF